MNARATNASLRVQQQIKSQRSARVADVREEKEAVAKKRRSPKQKAATRKAQRASVAARKGGKKKKSGKKRRKKRAAAAAPKRRKRKSSKRKSPKRRTSKRRTGRRRTSKRTSRRTSMTVPGTRVKIVKVPELRQVVVQKTPAKRRGKKRRSKKRLLDNPSLLSTLGTSAGDGGYLGMFENPAGPFSGAALKQFGTAAAGIGVGLVVAGFVDRWVATRTPKDGQHPWYGRDAAAVINSRPDAMRLGAQAVGGVGSMALAYYTRGRTLLPFLFGGIALGFGGKLVSQVLDWYLMPALFKVPDWSKPTFANRMYALEQDTVQKQLEAAIKNKGATQTKEDIPSAPGVQPTSPILSLGAQPPDGSTPQGKASAASDGNLGAQASAIVPTGRVGMCATCKGMNGCYSSCPDLVLCNECPGTAARRCEYRVKAGDDLYALVNDAGVDVNQVSAMNEGGDPSVFWQPGNFVELPFALCVYLSQRDGGPPPDYVPPAAGDAITATALLHYPVSGAPTELLGVGNEP